MQELKPCPFCGHEVSLEGDDTLYPNGVGWKKRKGGFTQYVSRMVVPEEQWCYSMHCPTTEGGCGAEISGDSKQQAIDNWNKRV
jgi:hypothetical protein